MSCWKCEYYEPVAIASESFRGICRHNTNKEDFFVGEYSYCNRYIYREGASIQVTSKLQNSKKAL